MIKRTSIDVGLLALLVAAFLFAAGVLREFQQPVASVVAEEKPQPADVMGWELQRQLKQDLMTWLTTAWTPANSGASAPAVAGQFETDIRIEVASAFNNWKYQPKKEILWKHATTSAVVTTADEGASLLTLVGSNSRDCWADSLASRTGDVLRSNIYAKVGDSGLAGEIEEAISSVMDDLMAGWECMYNPGTGSRQWYNETTNTWGDKCTGGI